MASHNDKIEHHGIKGQKWGVRRFQNEDGSLTDAGKKRYDTDSNSVSDEEVAECSNELLKKNPYLAIPRFPIPKHKVKRADGKAKDGDKELKKKKIKKAIAIALGVAVVAGASYAVYKHTGGKAPFKALPLDDSAATSKLKKSFKDYDIDESDLNGARFIANWCNFSDTKLKTPFTREDYNALSNNDGISLAKGSILHRISNSEETSMSKPGWLGIGSVEKRTCYCSFDAEDNDRYKAFLPAMQRVNSAGSWFGIPDKFYDVTMKAKSSIKSPSSKERVDTYLDVMSDPVNKEKFKNFMFDNKFPVKMVSAFDKDPIAGYRIFSLGLADQDTSYNIDYFSKLKKAGYNALVDDNDAGNLSKSPLIVLDPSKFLSIASNNPVTPSDRRAAWKRIASSSLIKNEDNEALNKALSPLRPLSRLAYKAYMKEILSNNASIVHSQIIGGDVMTDMYSFEHHGIKGQKWGVRRYQNADGTLTAVGKKRYSKKLNRTITDSIVNRPQHATYDNEPVQKMLMTDSRVKNFIKSNKGRYKEYHELADKADEKEVSLVFERDSLREDILSDHGQGIGRKIAKEHGLDPENNSKDAIQQTLLEEKYLQEHVPKYKEITNRLEHLKPNKEDEKRVEEHEKYFNKQIKDLTNDLIGSENKKRTVHDKFGTKRNIDPERVVSENLKELLRTSIYSDDKLEHHGIKGQKWGVRRYQNADGTLTDAGKRKYSKDLEKAEYKKYQEAYYNREKYSTKQLNEMNNRMNAEMNFRRNLDNARPESAGAKLGKEWGKRFATAIALLAVSEGSRYVYSKGKEGGFALIRDLAQNDEGDTGMNELYSFEHHGIKGQKWGVRRTPEQLGIDSHDSYVTKKVKKDYNQMNDNQFKAKYKTSKKVYAKRVAKYGDPYKNSPLAKTGRKLNKIANSGMRGGNAKKNREALADMRTNMKNDTKARDSINRDSGAGLVANFLGGVFGGYAGAAMQGVAVGESISVARTYTKSRQQAYELTKKKYGKDAADRALRHQKARDRAMILATAAAVGTMHYSMYKSSQGLY